MGSKKGDERYDTKDAGANVSDWDMRPKKGADWLVLNLAGGKTKEDNLVTQDNFRKLIRYYNKIN